MRGKGKYGGVKLVAIRDKDGLKINCGTAASYEIGRQHAMLLLASTSAYRCIHIIDLADHRINTVRKVNVGERQLD